MDLAEARKALEGTTRFELRDHSFGDREVFWEREGVTIAEGYFGGEHADVGFNLFPDVTFLGDEARSLLECGTLKVERNDEAGPAEFKQGVVMSGLTLAGVFEELTKEE